MFVSTAENLLKTESNPVTEVFHLASGDWVPDLHLGPEGSYLLGPAMSLLTALSNESTCLTTSGCFACLPLKQPVLLKPTASPDPAKSFLHWQCSKHYLTVIFLPSLLLLDLQTWHWIFFHQLVSLSFPVFSNIYMYRRKIISLTHLWRSSHCTELLGGGADFSFLKAAEVFAGMWYFGRLGKDV